VATGDRLSRVDVTVVATEYALNHISEVRLQLSRLGRLVLPPDAAQPSGPLSGLTQCLCALHKAAESICVSEETPMALPRRAVLTHCDASGAPAAVAASAMATLLVAYLHLVAFLSLEESTAKVEGVLLCKANLVRP
jgi:hypothetical protein